MKQKIGVALGLESKIRSFLEKEKIDLELVSPGEGVIQIETPEPKKECDGEHFYPKGRIACALALGTARKLGIPPASMGRLLNLLEIKIHNCQLGCF